MYPLFVLHLVCEWGGKDGGRKDGGEFAHIILMDISSFPLFLLITVPYLLISSTVFHLFLSSKDSFTPITLLNLRIICLHPSCGSAPHDFLLIPTYLLSRSLIQELNIIYIALFVSLTNSETASLSLYFFLPTTWTYLRQEVFQERGVMSLQKKAYHVFDSSF